MSTNEKAAFALLFQYIYINYVITMWLVWDYYVIPTTSYTFLIVIHYWLKLFTARIKKKLLKSFFFRLSGWRDSNSRPPAPKAGILTGLNYIPHTSFSKASAKVLLFFDMTKYFQKKMQKKCIFFEISVFLRNFARFFWSKKNYP